VHPNTFRYRLAKISDIVNVDLENREDRLLVELDLLRVRFTP
jgi:DNA-binding PucR family transcriptional regulator